jgi:diguanylate cyclase (GGDEF)-like protein/PAS domain S-box-containing protein
MKSAQKSSILIVDDTPANIKILFDLLNQAGFQLSVAKSGKSALQKVHQALPDLILLDIKMPGIDGFETYHRLKAHPQIRDIPVIFMTALSDSIDKVQGLKLGAVDYITKPIEPEEVLARVENQLALQSAKAQICQLNAELERRVQERTAQLEALNQELEREIADRRAAEKALSQSEEQFRLAFELASIGMAIATLEGKFVQSNQALCDTLGYTARELRDRAWADVIYPEDRERFLASNQELRQGQIADFQLEQRFVTKTGLLVCGILQVALVRDAEGKPLHFISQLMDISDRKQAEEQLLYNALHDALTKLPNRTLLMERLELALKRAKRYNHYLFAVLFIDLDRFKVVNDSLGHQAGDRLLIAIARQLESIVRTTDTVVRLGGDEFVILLDPIEELNDAVQVVERIAQQLQAPFHLEGRELFVTSSIGIALSSANYESGADLLRDADIAMYRAKEQGKMRYEIFDRQMYACALDRLQLEQDLRYAIEHQAFCLNYQPIVSLKTGKLKGFEALVRWYHPERGLVSPAEFIPIAEETGLIVALGEWVLHSACEQMVVWQDQFSNAAFLKISINLSLKQLREPHFLEKIDRILLQTGLASQNLQLELTESMLVDNIGQLIVLLEQLRARAIQLSIDDFGTGYSCLSYLHRFPVNSLKIDRSFVSRIGEKDENQAIVRTIIALASQLGMAAIAEGVETIEQLQQLRALDCDDAQGYFFSQPLETEAVAALLERNSHESAIAQGFSLATAL